MEDDVESDLKAKMKVLNKNRKASVLSTLQSGSRNDIAAVVQGVS